MQNLRDKLLKAGLVNEDQAKKAEREVRTKPRAQTHRQREEKGSEEERQRREAFALREAELAEQRRKGAAKKEEARKQSERAHRLRQLVEANRLPAGGELSFHYVRRSGKIGRIDVAFETQKQLESGAAALVEDPGSPDCAVVPGETAKKVYELDPQAIRFWSGPEKPIGFSDAGE